MNNDTELQRIDEEIEDVYQALGQLPPNDMYGRSALTRRLKELRAEWNSLCEEGEELKD